ncbi:FAD-dependent oxidoreductase [Jannaschia sp. LMIT008]|uniref:FAD-dependent oxidoreductase n=1 Tax=Jannaschia maritima TaxID=3032585 RepID=UPI0028120CD0|nr:FAD-dependent oxidoreductase [Jannaschia sp. LMIT008]
MPDHDLAALSDLPQDEPVKAMAGERAILLIRTGDDVTALTHECPHLGLPLSKGVVRDGTLICAFHHACFDARTGAQTQPPGHGDLQRFAVAIRDGRVIVDVPDDAPAHPMPDRARGTSDARRFVVAGGGAAAMAAAAELRERGFDGVIEMVSPDGPPLDRTMLSKAVLAGAKAVGDLALHPTPADLDIATIAGRVIAVGDGTVTLEGGGTRAFDALLLAPGGTPRRLDVPGAELPGVYVLRSGEDAAAIAAAAEGAETAIVVGGGFIGMEAALSLTKRGLSVTLATRNALPLAGIVGPDVARAILAEHVEAGVSHLAETEAVAFRADGDGVAVDWKDGGTARADLILTAVGVTPGTDGIDGIDTGDDGGVRVGPGMGVPGRPGVHVAGDSAAAPTPFGTARIEHWRVAQQHGRRAARAMLGQAGDADDIPFFWTALARQYRYLGHAEEWDRIDIDGDPSGPFLARYVKGGTVVAALTAGRDAELAEMHLAMARAGGPVPA